MNKSEFNQALKDIQNELNHDAITPSQAIGRILDVQHDNEPATPQYRRIQEQLILETAPLLGSELNDGGDEYNDDDFYIEGPDNEFTPVDQRDVDAIIDQVVF